MGLDHPALLSPVVVGFNLRILKKALDFEEDRMRPGISGTVASLGEASSLTRA